MFSNYKKTIRNKISDFSKITYNKIDKNDIQIGVQYLKKENKMKIIDDDGGREICWEDKENTLLTKQEAFNYFIKNTIEFKESVYNER